MKFQRKLFIFIIGVALLVGSSSVVFAEYPDRPVTVIVAFKAGGSLDTIARLLAKKMGEELGQPVVVTNKGGGGGSVGATVVKNSKPDGYTISFNVSGAFAISPIVSTVSYKSSDFQYLATVVQGQEGFVSLSDKPYKNFKELVKYAKDNNVVIKCAVMSPWEKIALKYIGEKEGIKFLMIPTRGGAAVMTSILGGHVDFGYGGGLQYKYISAGKMISLAATTEERHVAFPDVPTLKEFGYELELNNYFMYAAPKGVPDEIVQKLVESIQKAAKAPAFMDLIKNKMHLPLTFKGPAALTTQIEKMHDDFLKTYSMVNK